LQLWQWFSLTAFLCCCITGCCCYFCTRPGGKQIKRGARIEPRAAPPSKEKIGDIDAGELSENEPLLALPPVPPLRPLPTSPFFSSGPLAAPHYNMTYANTVMAPMSVAMPVGPGYAIPVQSTYTQGGQGSFSSGMLV
jgi:hypothetical protein